jgi:predicted transcriptional regulator of viral defense system
MSAAAMYSTLRRLSVPVVTTAEAAAALQTSGSAASRGLRTLEEQGLVRRLRHGSWILTDQPLDPRAIVTELTRPFPAYISFQSALAARGAIDQIPREISVASLAKPRRIETRLATYVIHRLPPALFGGFEESGGVALATVVKALFDYFYVASASGRTRARLPELDLPANFSRKQVETWLARIRSSRLRTRVRAAIERALEHAEYEDARGGRRRPATRKRARVNAIATRP